MDPAPEISPTERLQHPLYNVQYQIIIRSLPIIPYISPTLIHPKNHSVIFVAPSPSLFLPLPPDIHPSNLGRAIFVMAHIPISMFQCHNLHVCLHKNGISAMPNKSNDTVNCCLEYCFSWNTPAFI